MRALLFSLLLLLAGAASAQASEAPSDFADWAAVVIAGDWHAHDGSESNEFDNARRDVAAALTKAGFAPANIRQYSLRPPRPGDDLKIVVPAQAVFEGFNELAARAPGGCLFYLTSHGNQEGAVFGPDGMLRPAMLHRILDKICPGRPTIAVISACFSGVFVGEVAAPDHMVMTAAREDRSSFGCSSKDRYPYFDACMLESLPTSGDFLALSRKIKGCVGRKESELDIVAQGLPASEPQTFVGSQLQLTLPFMRLIKTP